MVVRWNEADFRIVVFPDAKRLAAGGAPVARKVKRLAGLLPAVRGTTGFAVKESGLSSTKIDTCWPICASSWGEQDHAGIGDSGRPADQHRLAGAGLATGYGGFPVQPRGRNHGRPGTGKTTPGP